MKSTGTVALSIVAAICGLCPWLRAQPPNRYLDPKPPFVAETQTNQISYIVTSNAWCAAVSEPAAALLIGYWPKVEAAQLAVYWLDAAGLVSTNPVTPIALPKPATLAAYTNFAHGFGGWAIAYSPRFDRIYLGVDSKP